MVAVLQDKLVRLASEPARGKLASLEDVGFTPGLNGRPFEAGLAGRYMRVKRMFAAVHGRSPLPRPPVSTDLHANGP